MGFLYTMFVSRGYFDRLERVLVAVAVAERWLSFVNVWTVQKKNMAAVEVAVRGGSTA